MISTEMAYNLRYNRGLILPGKQEYENPRMKEIAVLQEFLWNHLNHLDKEIQDLYYEEMHS